MAMGAGAARRSVELKEVFHPEVVGFALAGRGS